MKRSLKAKLILSYLAIALVTVLVVSVVIRLTSGQYLMNLVVQQQTALLQDAVQTFYTANGSLHGFFLSYNPAPPDGQNPNPDQPTGPDQGPQRRDFRGLHGLVDTNYRALIPTFGYQPGQKVPLDAIKNPVPVQVDGQTVAYILPDTSLQFKLSSEEQLFLQRTTLAIGLAAGAGVLLALVMGFLLAGGLLKPIRRLTGASKELARGNLQQKVPVTSSDELGELTATFNQMTSDLYLADQQRKRLAADISHDLSTPLQVISGYLEMLEEGGAALTPQRLEIIKTELGHLRRMVGDLSTLAQVEAGGLEMQLQPESPRELLNTLYHTYQPIAARQGVALHLDAPAGAPDILVDEGRTLQVLKNLVENALRYTPAGGRIILGAVANGRVQLSVSDTGAGIDPEDLPYVFDRFYQADKARGANAGKMGLGLAICKALVTAQNGEITAASGGRGQGTCITITFDPLPPS